MSKTSPRRTHGSCRSQLDLTNHEQIAQAAEHAADVTLLVNNGGSLNFADPLSGDLDAIHTDIVTNVVGPLVAARQFVPVLERNGGGAIVNLLSLVVFGSVPAMGGYSASKAAAASVTQALRAQLGGAEDHRARRVPGRGGHRHDP